MHHSRRKSGQAASSAPASEVRGAHRTHAPARKAREGRGARSPRERDYEWDDAGRDTFPQYCMTCEKQFLPPDDSCLYCSEACREYDSTTSPRLPGGSASNGYGLFPTPHPAAREPRDIVPRASPSRPAPTAAYAAPNDAVTALRSLTIRPVSPAGGGWPFGEKYPATYDAAYAAKGGYGYGSGGGGGERPLPRRPGYSRKSTELVTPVVGR